jgi:hypothetical protein
MNRRDLIAVLAVLCLTIDTAIATDPYPLNSLSEIKDRWAQAASGRERMHAEYRQLVYDHVYRTVSESEGTLDFERPDRCRLELRPVSASAARIGGLDDQPNSRSALTTVWTGDELIVIDPVIRVCDVVQLKPASHTAEDRTNLAIDSDETALDDQRLEEIRNFDKGDWFWEALVATLRPAPRRAAVDGALSQASSPPSLWLATWRLYAPVESLPVLLSDPDSVARLGFKLVQWTDRKRMTSAFPVTREARERYQVDRIDILFDESTGLPYATRAVGEHRTIVRILEKVRVNPVPGRPDLFDPDLEALDRNWTINR